VFAIGTGESPRAAIVMGTDVSGEVGAPGESMRAEGTQKGMWVLTMSEEVDLEHGTEDRSK